MTIYRHQLGAFLKVHSFNEVAPGARVEASPRALILVCHGIYDNHSGMVTVPATPEVRFSVDHGQPNDRIDYKYFQDIIKCGLDSALEYDFKFIGGAGNQVRNYYLGKGEPDKEKGASAKAMMGYDKKDRIKRGGGYDERLVGNVGVISTGYVENIMRYAERVGKQDSFDFATVTRSCESLRNVLDSIAANPAPRYDFLLCAFCREFMD